MPQESIRVYFTMVDGASQVMATIGDQTRALEKETQLLQQTQQGLSKANRELLRTQSELQSHRYTPETIEAVFQWILKEAGTAENSNGIHHRPGVWNVP